MANKYTLGILSSFPQTKLEFSTKEVQLNAIKCNPINSISKENIELTAYKITNPINITPTIDESTGENYFNLQETSYGYIQQTWNMSDSVIKYYTLPSEMELSAGSGYNPITIPIIPETISTFIIDNNSFGINFGIIPFDEIIIDIPVEPPIFKDEVVPVLAFTMGKDLEYFEEVKNANGGLDSFSAYWIDSNYFSGQYNVLRFGNFGTFEYAALEQKYQSSFVFQGWNEPGLAGWIEINYLSGTTFGNNELRDLLIVDMPTLTPTTELPNKWIFTTYRSGDGVINGGGKYVGAVKHYDTPYMYGKYDFLNQPPGTNGLLDNSVLLRLNKEESYLHTSNNNRVSLIVPPKTIIVSITGFAGFGKYDNQWSGLTPDGTIDITDGDSVIYMDNVTYQIYPNEYGYQISYASYKYNQSFEYDENEFPIVDYSKFKTVVTLFYNVGQFDPHQERSQENPQLYLMYIPEEECFNIQEIAIPQNEKVYGSWIISYFNMWTETPFRSEQENYHFLESHCESTFKLNKNGDDEDTSGVIYPAFIKRDTSIYKEDVPFGRYTFYDWQDNKFIEDIYMDIMPSENLS